MAQFEDDHPIWNHVTTTITELPDLISWCDEGAFMSLAQVTFALSEPSISPPFFVAHADIVFSIDSDIEQVVPVASGGAWMPFQGNPVFWQQAFTAVFEPRVAFSLSGSTSYSGVGSTQVQYEPGSHLAAMPDGRLAVVWGDDVGTPQKGYLQIFLPNLTPDNSPIQIHADSRCSRVFAKSDVTIVTGNCIGSGSGFGGHIANRNPDTGAATDSVTFLVGEQLDTLNIAELPNGNILAVYNKRTSNQGAFRIFSPDLSSEVVSEVIFFSADETDTIDVKLQPGNTGNWLATYRNDDVGSFEYVLVDQDGVIIKQGVISTNGYDNGSSGMTSLPNGSFAVSHAQGQSTTAGGNLWVHLIDGTTGEIIQERDISGIRVIGTPRFDSGDLTFTRNNHIIGIYEVDNGGFSATSWDTIEFELDASLNIRKGITLGSPFRSNHAGGWELMVDTLQNGNVVYTVVPFYFIVPGADGYLGLLSGNPDRWNMSYNLGDIKPTIKSVDPTLDWAADLGPDFTKVRINFTKDDLENPLIATVGNFTRVQLQAILQGGCTFNRKQVDGYLSGEEIELPSFVEPATCHVNQMANWHQDDGKDVYWDSIEYFTPGNTWMNLIHQGFWNIDFGSWNGSSFDSQNIGNHFVALTPSSDWNVNFAPTKMKITYTGGPITGVLIADRASELIAGGSPITYNSGDELIIDWLGWDTFYHTIISTVAPFTVTKIEYLVEDLIRPYWDRKLLDETWVLGPDPGTTEYGSWSHADLEWSSEFNVPAHLLNVYAREGYTSVDWNLDYRPSKARFWYTGTINEIWIRDKNFGIMHYSDATPPASGVTVDVADLGFDIQQCHFSSTAGSFVVNNIEFLK